MQRISVRLVGQIPVLDMAYFKGCMTKIWVCDMVGREIYSHLGITKSSIALNVELDKGSYLVNASSGSRVYTEKILVIVSFREVPGAPTSFL
ncbi:MAG: T9SS type A sorting domain-containing protein [Flavobacteriales bacterium]